MGLRDIPGREISLALFPPACSITTGQRTGGDLVARPGATVFYGRGDHRRPNPTSAGATTGRWQAASLGEGPFVLSEALPVVAAKLIRKVEKGEFVDMADFLKDNIEAERMRMPTGNSGMSGLSQASR